MSERGPIVRAADLPPGQPFLTLLTRRQGQRQRVQDAHPSQGVPVWLGVAAGGSVPALLHPDVRVEAR